MLSSFLGRRRAAQLVALSRRPHIRHAHQTPQRRLAPLILLAIALPASFCAAQTSVLDNGTLRVAVDLARGGAISELGESGSTVSVVNVRDLGRYIQQSYYSGPDPYVPDGAVQHPAYLGWGWNPVQAGDVFGYPSPVLASSNDGVTLHTRCVPQQWALRNVAAACTLDTWITLDANRAHVRCRLTNARTDTTRYTARHQELPAVYTVGTLHRLFTYTGDAPFTSGALTQIVNSGPPWEYWTATEHWSAQVDDDGWGLGVHQATAQLTVGGFHGTPGWGGPTSVNTGYIAPLHTDLLDHDITYEYQYTLILGDLEDDIRAWAVAQAPAPGPDLVFTADRQHCVPANLTDQAPPFDGAWRLQLDSPDPRLVSAPMLWQADDVPQVSLRAAFATTNDQAALFFADQSGTFSGDRRVPITVIPDGVMRTYTVDLSGHPLYAGAITRLRLDPIESAVAGDVVELHSLRSLALTAAPLPRPASRLAVLEAVTPNPFNPMTEIRYRVQAATDVTLTVFDAAGRRVRTLVDAQAAAPGAHAVPWDGRDDAGRGVASGTYLCVLRAGGQVDARSVALVR